MKKASTFVSFQSKTDPLGNTESYDWDETKGLLNATETAYGVTSYTYDALGRLTETRTPDGLRSTVTGPSGKHHPPMRVEA